MIIGAWALQIIASDWHLAAVDATVVFSSGAFLMAAS